LIAPKHPQSTAAVAAHYNQLDQFYREIWGEHVHHGYWTTGRETAQVAVIALIERLAGYLDFHRGQHVCDIGCGYGATARHFAAAYGLHVTGVTISAAQAQRANAETTSGGVSIQQRDWLSNDFPAHNFDRAYAIESSEHMADKQRFFTEAFRTLKPGGLFAVCAWLARDDPRPWEVKHLLEPICREGRLPGMGNEADYLRLGAQAGFELRQVEDLSMNVRRTWGICVRRALAALATQPRYLRFLLDRTATDRIFAMTLLRIMAAYRTGTMRYGLFVFRRPAA
jgi:tocopherol O-methyltransferase